MNKLKHKIQNAFMKSEYKVYSKDKLSKYIDICINKNNFKKIKNDDGYSRTACHHILPKSLFPSFSDLLINPWNSTHLYHAEHYYVHWLLCGIFGNKNYKMNEAFLKMHNCDLSLGRIKEDDLINGLEYQILIEDALSIRSQKMKEYLNKKIILPSGEEITQAKENGKKISDTLTKTFMNEEGIETTIAKERVKDRNNFVSVIEIKTGTRKGISSEEYQNNRDLYESTAKKSYSKKENSNNIERQTTIREVKVKGFHYSTKSGIPLRKWIKENELPMNIYTAALQKDSVLKLGKNNKHYNDFNDVEIYVRYK